MYNPFEKRIEELTLEDTKSLQSKQVKEGFYVEYKSVFVKDTTKIAHSIASFANTHGGWYFVGIDSDTTNLPTSFSGFSMTDQPKPIEHIRDIIKDKVDPFPLYYTRLIELGNGNAILVVEIPESDETPHVTKDGKIYRRNAEGSDPVPESNRYVLDKLYEKSQNLQKEIERFCCREVVLSKAEENNSYLEIYLMPYPLNRIEIDNFWEKDFVDKLKQTMNDPTKIVFTEKMQMEPQIPFNHVAASWKSIILRQVNPGNLRYVTLTFELSSNGNAKIIIPFMFLPHDTERDSPAWRKLISALEEEDASLFHIIDGYKTLSIFVTLLQKYIDILRSQSWQEKILIAYHLENTWRNILFFDSDAFINHIVNFGVPICQRENGWIPRLEKRSMVNEMPEDGIFQLSEFFLVSTHFGTFPHDVRTCIEEWIDTLPKKEIEKP
jgi:hypothetical protein